MVVMSTRTQFGRVCDLTSKSVMEFFNDNRADALKPSLFELLAQEELRDLLQPALKYVLAVMCQLLICPAIPAVSVTDSE
jgi:hypothetical protein